MRHLAPRLKGWVSQASSLPVTLSPLSPRHATVAAPGRCVSAALAQWSREPQGGYEERVWVMGASTQTGGDGMGGVQHTKMGGGAMVDMQRPLRVSRATHPRGKRCPGRAR